MLRGVSCNGIQRTLRQRVSSTIITYFLRTFAGAMEWGATRLTRLAGIQGGPIVVDMGVWGTVEGAWGYVMIVFSVRVPTIGVVI